MKKVTTEPLSRPESELDPEVLAFRSQFDSIGLEVRSHPSAAPKDQRLWIKTSEVCRHPVELESDRTTCNSTSLIYTAMINKKRILILPKLTTFTFLGQFLEKYANSVPLPTLRLNG